MVCRLILIIVNVTVTIGAVATAEEPAGLERDRLRQARSIFEDKCALCHDSDGTGLGEKRLNLANGTWHHGGTLADIEKTIREGVPDTMMKPMKETFPEEQIADLAKYVDQLFREMHAAIAKSERDAATKLTDSVSSHLPTSATPESPKYKEVARANFIDDYVFDKMKANDIPRAVISGDTEFMRRVYFDLWGRPPAADKVRKFVEDTDPEKRNKLIDNLLGLDFLHPPDDKEFKEIWQVGEPYLSKWRFFFEDLFKNFYNGRKEIHDALRSYIHLYLKYNVPYDEFVRELITASSITGRGSGASGYLVQVKLGSGEGEKNHEDTCDDIAIRATKNFLGVNLECISCHDGSGHLEGLNLWLSQRKRVEFWRQAAFFGKTHIRFKKRRGTDQPFFVEDRLATAGYQMESPSALRTPRNGTAKIYPAFVLNQARPLEGTNPRREFAQMLTSDFQFAKTTVNLIWSRLMTVGIVDPPFEWDLARQDPKNPPPAPWTLQPSHPELLDALASDFVEHHYDLRHLMRTICRSTVYQLSSRFEGQYHPDYDRYYARKLVRRLSAEEIYDALAESSNVFGHTVDGYPEWKSGYSMDLPSPLSGLQFCEGELREFLFFFGRGNRNTIEPNTNTSVIQASVMLYSGLVKRKVLASTEGSRTNALLQQYPPWTWREPQQMNKLVEELYLTTLSRFPDPEELANSIQHLERYRDKGVENLHWALFNKLEFVVNY